MISKGEIRKINKKRRAQMTKEDVLKKSREAVRHFLDSDLYKNAKQIMIYLPLGNELDLGEIREAAHADGKTVLVPVTDENSGEITPCVLDIDMELEKGAFSVLEPSEKVLADMTKTDVVMVPGIAFDERGGRVGFGKGCYDRLLKKADTVFLGVCFDFQVSDEIELTESDVRMDFLLKESGFLKCK